MPLTRIGISFSGSGHLLCYHLGIARTLLENDRSWAHLSGTSGGAVAAVVASTLSLNEQYRFHQDFAIRCHALTGLKEMLHEQAHIRANLANTHIGVTACKTGESIMLSNFESRSELIDAIVASCRFPRSFHPLDVLWDRIKYPEDEGKYIRGVSYIDGGLSNLCPVPGFTEQDVKTLRVSPFSGPPNDLLLCPAKPLVVRYSLPNFGLGQWSVRGLPVHLCLSNVQMFQTGMGAPPHVLERLYDSGRSDAENYLKQNPVLD